MAVVGVASFRDMVIFVTGVGNFSIVSIIGAQIVQHNNCVLLGYPYGRYPCGRVHGFLVFLVAVVRRIWTGCLLPMSYN